MTTSTRRWLVGFVVATCALTLAACDGGEDPTTPPETTATEPSTEPSEDVTTEGLTGIPPELEAPEAPPEMEVDDATGAAAATWYFLKIYDYMRATGDTSQWEAMTAAECEWCTETLESAAELHEEGGWIDSPELSFDITTATVELPGGDQPFYVVRQVVVQEPYTVVHGDGTTASSEGETLDPMSVALQYADGRFVVVGVNFEPA